MISCPWKQFHGYRKGLPLEMAEGLGEAPCLGTGDPRRDPAPLAPVPTPTVAGGGMQPVVTGL